MGRLYAAVAGSCLLALAAPAAAEQQARTAPATARPAAASLARAAAATRTPEEALAEELRAIWAGRPLRRGTTGMYVVDAKTGETLFAAHEDQPLNPASNVKLVSTATALSVLGPDWRYATQLLGPQPDADGVIRGDVYLYGQADPTLRAAHLEAMAAELLAAGAAKIEGAILASEDPLRDALAHPVVTIRVTGAASGQPPAVQVSPPTSLVQVAVTAKTTDRRRRPRLAVSGQMLDDADGLRYAVTVAGEIRPGQTRTFERHVPRAALYTAHVLRGALVEAGIAVDGGARTLELDAYLAAASAAGTLPVELARHDSAPVSELVARINKPSDNFLADRLLMTVGAVRYGGPPSLPRGVDAMNEWMAGAGIDPGAVVLDTGSGLSNRSRMSAHQIVETLRCAAGYAAPDAPPATAEVFAGSLALAGVDGTLRDRYRTSPLAGILAGKTGTLSQVIALSGVIGYGDHAVVFAFVTNGHRKRAKTAVRFEHRRAAEKILDYLQARAATQARGPSAAVTSP
jgi:D-alanyl-D-alanine carboxypeptidase/D-alanyl-D-alanine-endopeptidase (penicillin-binding protein 4)